MTRGDIRATAGLVRQLPLGDVLRALGARQDRHDSAKWHTVQGVLSITGAKFMNWTRDTGGGGAIDLVMHVHGADFLAAVTWLTRRFPGAGLAAPAVVSRRSLRLPHRDESRILRVQQYLCHTRGLAADLITTLIDMGRLYADNRGNAVFVLLSKDGSRVGAELRGTCPQRPWRGMAPGSRKDAGYFAVPSLEAEGVVLCESAIDAISCACLHPELLCVSTAGARSDPAWLKDFIGACPVYCGFDADRTGDRMAEDMTARYPEISRLRPQAHDWNDTLRGSL
jgi:hypothetical protein